MGREEAFLAEVCARPDDDAPRLIFADWLDEHGDTARAEFIRVQIALARGDEDDPRRPALVRRQRALLTEHRAAWVAGLPPWARKEAVFARGFVEDVQGRASVFVKTAAALFAATPLRRVRLTYPRSLRPNANPDPKLADCPYLARLTALKVGGGFMNGYIGDAGVRTLVASPHLSRLETLDLSENGHTADTARAVAEAAQLTGLKELDLSGDRYGSASGAVGDEGTAALAASPYLAGLRTLRLCNSGVGAAGAAALAGSPYLRGLERLDLSRNRTLGPAGGLALTRSTALMNLRALRLDWCRLDAAATEAVLASPSLPRLCDVDMTANGVDPDGLRRALDGPAGARLERLVFGYPGCSGKLVVPVLAALRLRALALPSTDLGPEGVRALAAAPLLAGLRELDLAWNRCGDDGVAALAASPRAGNLWRLNLAGNDVTAAGARALAASPHLGRLHDLNLGGNKVRNDGARVLASSPLADRLSYLGLGNNGIVKKVKDELAGRLGGITGW